jgi:hypothetical protein
MDRTMGIYGLLNNRWSLILAMVTGAVHDAVAACWDAKYAYRAMRRAHRRHEQNRVLGAAAIPFKFMNPLRPGRDLASQDRLTRTTDEPRRTAPVTSTDGTRRRHASVIKLASNSRPTQKGVFSTCGRARCGSRKNTTERRSGDGRHLRVPGKRSSPAAPIQ